MGGGGGVGGGGGTGNIYLLSPFVNLIYISINLKYLTQTVSNSKGTNYCMSFFDGNKF